MSGRTTKKQRRSRRIQVRRIAVRVTSGPDTGRIAVSAGCVRIGADDLCDLVLTDPTVSGAHAEVKQTPAGVVLLDCDSTNGTWMGSARIGEAKLDGAVVFRVGDTTLTYEPQREEFEVEPRNTGLSDGLVGASEQMRELSGAISVVGPTELSILVTGETGTGKELVSRAIHTHSERRKGPLVVFDCGAVAPTLVESELFGHVRGAFTGAHRHREGVLEQANGGTLFLDEIGELPLTLQPKLLRALDTGTIKRIGGRKLQRVDVRIVAATNRDLTEEMAAGRFRADLFYRLAVVELSLPPLRERAGDLPLLVDHFLKTIQMTHSVVRVSDDALALLESWSWPGNVRELRNAVHRAVPFCSGEELTADAIVLQQRDEGLAVEEESPQHPADQPYRDARDQALDAFERAYVADLIERTEGNYSRAARLSGMDRRTVKRLVQLHGLGSPE